MMYGHSFIPLFLEVPSVMGYTSTVQQKVFLPNSSFIFLFMALSMFFPYISFLLIKIKFAI